MRHFTLLGFVSNMYHRYRRRRFTRRRFKRRFPRRRFKRRFHRRVKFTGRQRRWRLNFKRNRRIAPTNYMRPIVDKWASYKAGFASLIPFFIGQVTAHGLRYAKAVMAQYHPGFNQYFIRNAGVKFRNPFFTGYDNYVKEGPIGVRTRAQIADTLYNALPFHNDLKRSVGPRYRRFLAKGRIRLFDTKTKKVVTDV